MTRAWARFCANLGVWGLIVTGQFAGTVLACELWSKNTNTNDLLIGDIVIDRQDVFNTQLDKENRGLHRLANRLHIDSREHIIATQLLFKTGDAFDQKILDETARKLRANRYLRSASVTPTQVCDGAVTVLVQTGDNWSLIPGFNFARAGGENEYAVRLAELNLFGLGKSLELEFDFSNDREQRALRYFDPQLFGKELELTAEVQNNSDGEVQLVQLEKPFRSLNSHQRFRLSAGNSEYVKRLFNDGRTVGQLAVDQEVAVVEYGLSSGYHNNRVLRWGFGWEYDRKQLGPTERFPDANPVAERTFSFPFATLTFLQPHFIQKTNLSVMGSVEDIAIGSELSAKIGFAAEAFGSSTDSWVLSAAYSKGWQPGRRHLGLFSTSSSGYVDGSELQNGIAKASVQWFYFASPRTSSFMSANVVSTARLFEDQQVVIGGATGLRGYPLRFQTGSRRARLTVEQRYFFDWYPLRLARVGAAAFADIGSAWDKGEDPDWLRDAGLGLRIVSTRQAGAQVTHIDFAFPLDGSDRIDQFQLVVTAKTTF